MVDPGQAETSSSAPLVRVAVWDAPTRLFHWITVALFVALWVTGTDGSTERHIWLGGALLALLLFRLAWAIVGSRHSRLGDFIVGPRAAAEHVVEIVRVAWRGPPAAGQVPHVGHTRLGGWMIVLIFIVLLAQCVTGLFSSDDISVDAPLNHLVSSGAGHLLTAIHGTLFDVAQVLIAIHIAAALFYLVRKRENLIMPLITGRTRLPAGHAAKEGRFASPLLALAILIVAAAIVWGVMSL